MVSKTVIWKIWTICSYGNTWFIGTLRSKRQNKDREEDNKLAMSKPAFGDKEEYGALTCPAPLESLCSSNTTQCNACACWNEGQKHEASSKHLKSKRTGIFWSIHNQKALLRSQVAQGTATRVICTCMDFTDWAGNHLSPFPKRILWMIRWLWANCWVSDPQAQELWSSDFKAQLLCISLAYIIPHTNCFPNQNMF